MSALNRARALRAAGESEEAKALAEKLFAEVRSKHDASDVSAINLHLLGASAALSGRRYLGVHYLKQASEAAPSFLDARLTLAETYLKMGKPVAAVAALEAGEASFNGEPRFEFALAVAFEQAGCVEEAIAALEPLVEADPRNRIFSGKLIDLYLSVGHSAKAEALFEPLVEAGEVSRADVYLVLADNSLQRKELQAARRYLREAQRFDASLASLNRQFGRLYKLQGEAARENGQLSRAALFWNRALEYMPDDASLRVKVGTALVEIGSFEEAYSVLEGLLKSAPADPVYYTSLTKALRGKGDARLAYEILDGASDIMRRNGNNEAASLFERTLLEFAKEDREMFEKPAP